MTCSTSKGSRQAGTSSKRYLNVHLTQYRARHNTVPLPIDNVSSALTTRQAAHFILNVLIFSFFVTDFLITSRCALFVK